MFPSNHTEASLPLPEFCVNLNLRDEDSAFFTFKRTRLRNQGNLDERLVSLSRPLLSTCLKRVLCRLRISKLSVGTKSKKSLASGHTTTHGSGKPRRLVAIVVNFHHETHNILRNEIVFICFCYEKKKKKKSKREAIKQIPQLSRGS